MAFNGAGVFQRVRNWVSDAAAGVKIRADYHDAEDDGFAEGLSNCVTCDGQSIITQNIPFNSKRITGLEDPVNPQDASTKAYADTKLDAERDKDKLVRPGAIMDYATPVPPSGWLVADGSSVLVATYPDLFEAIGYSWGGSGLNFNLPPLQDRFRRGAGTAAGAVGTLQADQNKTHTHPVSITSGDDTPDHAHHIDFYTQANDRALDHTHSGIPNPVNLIGNGVIAYTDWSYMAPTGKNSGPADRSLDHLHRVLGDTGGAGARHKHAVTGNTGDSTESGAEARPLSATVLTCIKT